MRFVFLLMSGLLCLMAKSSVAEDLIQIKSVPVSNQAAPFDAIIQGKPDDEAAASVFAKTFEAQVHYQSWQAVASLAPMQKAFEGADALRSSTFRAAWLRWERQRLFEGWLADEDGRGMWKLEDGSMEHPQTLGIRQQPDGQWWIILLRTEKRPGEDGWSCSPSCEIRVSVAGRIWNMHATPPLRHAYRSADALGAPIPVSLLQDKSGQIWEFQMPGQDQVVRFDLSWWPSLCREKLGVCPQEGVSQADKQPSTTISP